MNAKNIKVLLIENNSTDARFINDFLATESRMRFEVDLADNYIKGLELLGDKPYDVILLNISDSEGSELETLYMVSSRVPEIPILVMTGNNDETLGIKAVQSGAQDYLVKESISRNLLVKSITYAIERNKLQMELMVAAHLDELTKLYNRRGFLSLAEQHKKVASRTNRGSLLFFIDLDGMKKINDSLGHKEGDAALLETANILRETFRESDIVSRLGGDEFVVLAIEINNKFSEVIVNRLMENVASYNSQPGNAFKLSFSIGVIHIDPKDSSSITELLKKADDSMYEVKRMKGANRS